MVFFKFGWSCPHEGTGMRLRALLVDDEALARARLRVLLADCQAPTAEVLAEAATAAQASAADSVPLNLSQAINTTGAGAGIGSRKRVGIGSEKE